jgi:hypothetical protein
MLLNKIDLLDKGFVAMIDFSGNSKLLQDLQNEYFKANINTKLLDISSATLIIKCPLFVQLNLSQYGLDIISTPSDNVEAYLPDLSMIEGDSLEERQGIERYIKATTEALLLNQMGMPLDGASKFTGQLLTPITVYNEIIVYGKLSNWLNYLKQKKLPKELELYRCKIKDTLMTEWRNIDNLLSIQK